MQTAGEDGSGSSPLSFGEMAAAAAASLAHLVEARGCKRKSRKESNARSKMDVLSTLRARQSHAAYDGKEGKK